jgi:hypothetical protein
MRNCSLAANAPPTRGYASVLISVLSDKLCCVHDRRDQSFPCKNASRSVRTNYERSMQFCAGRSKKEEGTWAVRNRERRCGSIVMSGVRCRSALTVRHFDAFPVRAPNPQFGQTNPSRRSSGHEFGQTNPTGASRPPSNPAKRTQGGAGSQCHFCQNEPDGFELLSLPLLDGQLTVRPQGMWCEVIWPYHRRI